MSDKKKTPEEGNENRIDLREINLTAAGEPLPIDPDTGKIDVDKLTDAQRAELDESSRKLAEAIKPALATIDAGAKFANAVKKAIEPYTEAIKSITENALNDTTRNALKAMQENVSPLMEFYDEMEELEPFIRAELEKDEYGGEKIEKAYQHPIFEHTIGELLELRQDPSSDVYKVFEAAKIVKAQQEGRQTRQTLKANALESGAIMQLRGGNLTFFSNQNLWDAFNPGRISKMGTLDTNFIDPDTGMIKKAKFAPGELDPVEPEDTSIKAFSLLSAIIRNTVDNPLEEFVKGGDITFYVKGVLEKFTDDPRTLYDNQLNFDRKTAGVLYLESLFEPLQGYIGTTANGSRYSVFNYKGYDAASDTITINTPYLYQLWRSTQQDYFKRQENIEGARADGKKPAKADSTPLEVNNLFKGKAYTANEITLEIAVYITNVLLTAGNKGRPKTTEIFYKTIIKNCPRFKSRLLEIEARPNIETLPDGKTRNNAALYNTELKKIKSAFDLILDPEKCDATEYYDFMSIAPAKVNKNGSYEIMAPTKSRINDKLVIKWKRKRKQGAE